MSDFDCFRLHSKCKADCCTLTPIEKDVYNRNRHNLVREVSEELDWVGYSPDGKATDLIMPFTESGKCPFLKQDYTCNIYDDRPSVCRIYGDESLPCMCCPYQDKNGKLRSRQQTRAIHRQTIKDSNKLFKKSRLPII